MKHDILPKIVLFGQPSRVKWKAGCPLLGWEDIIKKDIKKMGTSWEGVKWKALNRSVRSCVGLRRRVAAMSFY